jgi:hypothetical protein
MMIYHPQANEHGQKACVCGEVDKGLDHRTAPRASSASGLPVLPMVATPAVIGVMAAMAVMAANPDTDAANVNA